MAQLFGRLKRLLNAEPAEQRYLIYAKISAALSLIIAFCFAPGLITATNWQERTALADLASKIMAACAGLITFLTVIWRGRINERQYNEARRSNDVKDSELHSKLLSDGINLLDSESVGKVQAGLHILASIISKPGVHLGNSIMAIVGNFISTYIAEKVLEIDNTTDIAFNTLELGAKSGYHSESIFEFKSPDRYFFWRPIYGVTTSKVSGGRLFSCNEFFNTKAVTYIERMEVICCNVPRLMFKHCEFHMCRFEDLYYGCISESNFLLCDFSQTKFDFPGYNVDDVHQFFKALQKPGAEVFQNCSFSSEKPPILVNNDKLQDFDFSLYFNRD